MPDKQGIKMETKSTAVAISLYEAGALNLDRATSISIPPHIPHLTIVKPSAGYLSSTIISRSSNNDNGNGNSKLG